MHMQDQELASSSNSFDACDNVGTGTGDKEQNQSLTSIESTNATASEPSSSESASIVVKNETSSPKPNTIAPEEENYVYRDFSTMVEPPQPVHPQSLQAQKLPAKLASMLSDQDLVGVITWAPHGRSWRVLNRDIFAEHALRHYFGHKNYASFVRIVNAWGFRRITQGPDRDSYYHELFLRGRPDLHQRMKRLPSCHRKSPVRKEDQCPDFYTLSKSSPLPDVVYHRGVVSSSNNVTQIVPAVVSAGQIPQFSSMSLGVPAISTYGTLGGPVGNINDQVLSFFANDTAARSMNSSMIQSMTAVNSSAVGQQLPRVVQLQRDNEELRRRLLEIESKQGYQGSFGNQGRVGNQSLPLLADQRSTLSSNIPGIINSTGSSSGGNTLTLERELERMQRDFMVRSNAPVNNSLLPSFGGGATVGNGITSYPGDEMLLRAMRLENQMGFLQQSQGPVSTASSLMQQQNYSSHHSPPFIQTGDQGTKAVMDWLNNQKKM